MTAQVEYMGTSAGLQRADLDAGDMAKFYGAMSSFLGNSSGLPGCFEAVLGWGTLAAA